MSETHTERRSSRLPRVPGPERFRSLLVPVDLTPTSDRVLGRVALLPLADGARITVLHVVPHGLTATEQRRAERDAIRTLAEEVRHLRLALPRGIHVMPLVQTGAPAKAISGCVTRLKSDLVVMGRGRGRSLRDEFIGSTAERVVRQAKVPVLVVRLVPRSAYAQPALAITKDRAANAAVAALMRVLEPPRPSVQVIHAFDIPYRHIVYPSIPEDAGEERLDRRQLAAASEISTLLHKALTKANVPPEHAPVWRMHIRLGSPRMIVKKAVAKSEADLLVLGTHGHAGLPYLLLGTVAGDVLRGVKCDVLVVPPSMNGIT